MKKVVHTYAQKRLAAIILLFLALPALTPASGQVDRAGVLAVRMEGVITATSSELLGEALLSAKARGETVLLLIDTPGGVLDVAFRIVELIERSTVPVVGYVHPQGARAWSAGTLILMATHLAAMAPNTIIGSAQPVSFDPLGGGSTPIQDPKTINALSKYMAERARAHGRDEETAMRFVTENINLNDEEALDASMIEARAGTVDELLERIDGAELTVGGRTVSLRTSGAAVRYWVPSPRVRFLGLITEPVLAYMLFTIGFFALMFGLSTPGLGAEVLGGLMLVLGLIGLGLTGVNAGAVILMFAGFGLLLAEFFAPGFGILGIAGFVCVFLGSFLLFPSSWTVQGAWLNVLYTVLILVPLTLGGFLFFAAYKVIEARRRKPIETGLLGEEAVVDARIASGVDGYVRLRGEIWRARSNASLQSGTRVKVIGKEGPLLLVEPLDGAQRA